MALGDSTASAHGSDSRATSADYCAFALHEFDAGRVRQGLRTLAGLTHATDEKLAKSCLDLLATEIELEQASVMMRRDEELVVLAARGHYTDIVGKRMPRGSGIAWRVVEGGRDLHISGVFDQSRQNYAIHRCSALIPVFGHRAVLGSINLNRKLAGPNRREFLWCELIANLFGRAVDLATALAAEARPWRTWRDVLQLLAAQSEQDDHLRQERQVYAENLARFVGLEAEVETIGQAASVVDLARILLPEGYEPAPELSRKLDAILPEVTCTLLRSLGIDSHLSEIVRFAGERWDGQGPLGVAGEAIPLPSRVVAVAMALASPHAPRQVEASLAAVAEESGKAYCPSVVQKLLASSTKPG